MGLHICRMARAIEYIVGGSNEDLMWEKKPKYVLEAEGFVPEEFNSDDFPDSSRFWCIPAGPALCPNLVGMCCLARVCGVYARISHADLEMAKNEYGATVEDNGFFSGEPGLGEVEREEILQGTVDEDGRFLCWVTFTKSKAPDGTSVSAYIKAAEWAGRHAFRKEM